MEKKLDGNYTRMLRVILKKSWRQYPTKQQLYVHLPPITKTIQVRRTRHAGNCWRNRDELRSDRLLWTPSYGRAKRGRPVRTYVQQFCGDTRCSLEDLPEAMDDREEWQERVKDICADNVTWWWWWSILEKGMNPFVFSDVNCRVDWVLAFPQQQSRASFRVKSNQKNNLKHCWTIYLVSHHFRCGVVG